MKTNDKALNMIRKFEGLKCKPYKLPGETYYTVGYGHYGADVDPNRLYTITECHTLFYKDIKKFEKHILQCMSEYGYNFNNNEFSALVSFAFNIGNIRQLTNYGTRKKEDLPYYMMKYCKDSKGNILQGLYNRRYEEAELYKTPVDDTVTGEMLSFYDEERLKESQIYQRFTKIV